MGKETEGNREGEEGRGRQKHPLLHPPPK